MTDPIEFRNMDTGDMDELAELLTLITHACNRHKPVEACAVLGGVMCKILTDLREAPNFDEFADFVIEDLTKAINRIKP